MATEGLLGILLQPHPAAHASRSPKNSQLSESGLLPLCRTPELWYLLLWIPFVLIITINDWFGYLNASFRETSLLCHCYKLLPKLCFTQGGFIHSFIFFCPRDAAPSSKQLAGRAVVIIAEMSTRTAGASGGLLWGFFPPFRWKRGILFTSIFD